VSDYRLDDRAIEVRSLAGTKDFSSVLCVQTGSGAHPASCTMGTGGPFPGGKRAAGAWRWPLIPHLVPRSRMSRSCTSSPPQAPPWRVAGLLYFTFLLFCSKLYIYKQRDSLLSGKHCRLPMDICPALSDFVPLCGDARDSSLTIFAASCLVGIP